MLSLEGWCFLPWPESTKSFSRRSAFFQKTWGGILGQNPDRNLKSFPPCYSQTPLLTDCTSHLQFSWTWDFYSLALRFLQQQLGGVEGVWVNKYLDQWRVSYSQASKIFLQSLVRFELWTSALHVSALTTRPMRLYMGLNKNSLTAVQLQLQILV